MRRISYWILSTISATVLLFGFDASQRGSSIGGTPAAFSGGTAGTTSGTGTSSGSGTNSSGNNSSSTNSSGTSSATKSGGTSPKTQGSQPQTTSSTVTGATAQTRWGPVQIRLTIAAGKITKVGILQYPSSNSLDLQIANYAFPRLIQQTISTQGAHVDMVSGATYTSTGYLQSLQSALDQANL
ncbi:FMN-binding protein [Nocardioides cynanchi]|uniref:FMN-binding protein n=1 Tax=Nocardioides cynanchi TaxID=2558918 RepID=UPI001247F660|nr:FMN-binding protein [Nocardioides cynanchi]